MKWKYPECANPQAWATVLFAGLIPFAQTHCFPFHTAVRSNLFKPKSNHYTPLLSTLPRCPSHSKWEPNTLPEPAASRGTWHLTLLPASSMHTLVQAHDLPVVLLPSPSSGLWAPRGPPPFESDIPIWEGLLRTTHWNHWAPISPSHTAHSQKWDHPIYSFCTFLLSNKITWHIFVLIHFACFPPSSIRI